MSMCGNMCAARGGSLLDHFVGDNEKGCRNSQVEYASGLIIDYEVGGRIPNGVRASRWLACRFNRRVILSGAGDKF